MLRNPRRAAIAFALSLALGATAVVIPAMPAAAATPITNATLTDTSAAQQRWLSAPNSRVVLNPYNFDGSGSELSQNSGTNLPLSNGYYAHDKAIRTSDVLNTYTGAATVPPVVGYSTDFDTIDGWTAKDVETPIVAGGQITISPTKKIANSSWGSITSPSMTLDLGVYSKVTVKVPATTPAGVGLWSIKVNMGDAGGDVEGGARLMADTSVTGEFTYDLAAFMASYGYTGVQTFRLRLWTSNWNTGVTEVSSTFDSVSVHQPAAGSFPDSGQLVGWSDEFDSNTGWVPKDSGINLTTTGSKGTVSLTSGSWSHIASPSITIDLAKTPILSVKVLSGTGKWAMKLNDGVADDIDLQGGDVEGPGTFSYDLRNVPNWTGSKTFKVRLFQVGTNTTTTYDRISLHSGGVATRSAATSVAYAWTPAALRMTGTYPGGNVMSEEFFTADDRDAYTRIVTSDLNTEVIVAGAAEKAPTYNATTRVITVPGQWASRSIALPAGAQVEFFTSKSAFLADANATATPGTATRYWSATYPGVGVYPVGVSWAVNDGDNSPGAALATSANSALAATQDVAANRQHWVDFWDGYIAKVPVVQDFSIQSVATGGVTAAQMQHSYYQAWVGLEMNVLPATPETGNEYAQVGTGKPSMWMNGTPGTKNVASWDSLLGMQQLVFTDPTNAWDSFDGMMALVNDEPGATEPSDTAYGTRGELGGESLPSRKAQTAWILYQATGAEDRLDAIYDKLKLHINWEKYNMRWVLGGHNYLDERDSEFVASLVYDLKFAINIANELGHTADAAMWATWIPELTQKYEEWFFPTTADGNGKVWPTVQKIYLDANRTSSPSGEATESSAYRNENGQLVEAGFSFYTSTAFVMDQMKPEFMNKVMDRFLDDYDPNRQLAGLGKYAVKAPDIQLLTYGLLDMGEIDKATVVLNSITRDTVISGWFAEVYQETGTGAIGGPITSRGVRPSLFGISNYIDFVLMANGVRTDEGVPTFVRLPGATGGVSGLTYMGENLDVDIDGTTIKLSGAAVNQGILPSTVDASVPGQSAQPAVQIADDARLVTLTVNGASVAGFDANKTAYAVTLPARTTTVPTVAATASRSGAQVVVTPAASVPGTAKVTVTSANGLGVKAYTIAFTVASVVVPDPDPKPVAVPVKFTSITTKATSFGKASSVTVKTAAAGKIPTGVVRVYEGTKLLAQKSVSAGNAVIALPKNLKVGKHTLKVTFTPALGTNLTAPTAKATFVKVSKATARVTKTKVTKGKLKKGQRVTIRVTLKGVTGAKPSGKVYVLLAKKKVGAAKVKKTKAGYTATIKTKKLAKKGKISVTYSGNKSLVKKTFTSKLRVK